MLKNIPTNLSSDLLKLIMEMGHGDELIIADGNFPAKSLARNYVSCHGQTGPQLLDSILTLLPLDSYGDYSVGLMEAPDMTPPIWQTYYELIDKHEGANKRVKLIERFAFYEVAKRAYVIAATSESAIYANILLRKGVL